jgi:AAHS family benzoate transporter-like MFS transporter
MTAFVSVVALCWMTIALDGYDVIVYGAVVPDLLRDSTLGPPTPTQVGAIASYALFGMLIGALTVGTLADLIGRRRVMLFCVTWFSLAMGLCAVAPGPEFLGIFRFLAGVGLGGVLPTASALTIEYAPSGRKDLTYAIMSSGISVGGMVAAGLGIALIPVLGWRVMFALGLLGLVVVVPAVVRFMPESISYLVSQNRLEEAEALAVRFRLHVDKGAPNQTMRGLSLEALGRTLKVLFSREYVAATVLFWVATFAGLLLVFGLNTWLPEIMQREGYPVGSALTFLLVLNLGAIVSTIIAGAVADRVGSKFVCAIAFCSAAVSMFLLSQHPSQVGIYVLVAFAGLGSVGSQILVNTYVAKHYPVQNRATALGWSLGIGRLGAIFGPLLGGILVGLGAEWNFYVFAATALVGLVTVVLVPATPLAQSRRSVIADPGMPASEAATS